MTHNLATGVKNGVEGKIELDQRFRYPRSFDIDTYMPQYDYVLSHAHTALRLISTENKYRDSIVHYALDISNLQKRHFRTRILIITNDNILLVYKTKKLKRKIKLNSIRGIMNYYYDHQHTLGGVKSQQSFKQNSIVLER